MSLWETDARQVLPGFAERVLTSLPGLAIVTDADGVISYSAGTLGPYTREPAILKGSKITDNLAAEEVDRVTELLAEVAASPSTETVGPVVVSYRDSEGVERTAEAWAINRLDDAVVNGLVLLLRPESAYDRFDDILMHLARGAPLDEVLGALAAALGRPPVASQCYFLLPAKDGRATRRIPDGGELPGPPGPGPWDRVFGGEIGVFSEIDSLPAGLAASARRSDLGSAACYSVHPDTDGRPAACLVAWSRASGRPQLSSQLALERAAAIASLAISHHAAESGLRDAAYRDQLTGLSNRRGFFEALDASVNAGEQPAVLYIDLDGFKEVNDTFGHLAGDAVLRIAARRLGSVMRPTDELARLGGDEFAVLCRGSVSVDQMAAIADRVVAQLNGPLSVGDGQSVEVGASVGIALGLASGTPSDTVLGHADRALYEAKARGRGQYAFADPRPEVHP